jgi:nitroreductase
VRRPDGVTSFSMIQAASDSSDAAALVFFLSDLLYLDGEDVSARAAVMRNWEFFRAPLAGIVCMHRDLGPADALSVRMFLKTLPLALTERGLGSYVEVSIAGYPEIVRAQLAIPAELSILCGLAVGYPDPDFPANRLHVGREPIKENVVFLDN